MLLIGLNFKFIIRCTFNDAYECGDVNELESTKCNEHATRTACLNKKCVTPEEFAANGSVITFSVALAAFVLATLIWNWILIWFKLKYFVFLFNLIIYIYIEKIKYYHY